MSLGGSGGGILSGPSKIGSGAVVALVAATWNEIVLQPYVASLRPYPRTRYSIVVPGGNVFLAQGNHGLTQRGIVVGLPTDPTVVVDPTFATGLAFLLASTYQIFEAERFGENSLWIFPAAGATLAYLTNISYTPYDDRP